MQHINGSIKSDAARIYKMGNGRFGDRWKEAEVFEADGSWKGKLALL